MMAIFGHGLRTDSGKNYRPYYYTAICGNSNNYEGEESEEHERHVQTFCNP